MAAHWALRHSPVVGSRSLDILHVAAARKLAAALDIQAGERVRWQLLGRSELRLVRLEPPTLAKGL